MKWCRLWLYVAALALWAPMRSGAQTFEGDRGFAVERHRMALDDGGILSVEGAEVTDHLDWNIGLWVGAADAPLVLNRRNPGGGDSRVGDLVSTRVGGSLTASLGLLDWFQVGLDVPLILYQERPASIDGVDGSLPGLQTFGLGGPRLALKVRLLREEDAGLALALIPAVTLPAPEGGSYLADSRVAFVPEASLAKTIGPVRTGLNVGYRTRPTDNLLNISIDDELLARLGIGLELEDLDLPPFGLDVGLSVATSVKSILRRDVQDHIELLSGLRYDFDGPLLAFAGTGVGLQRGHGTPDWRVFAGLRFTGLYDVEEPVHRPVFRYRRRTVAPPPPVEKAEEESASSAAEVAPPPPAPEPEPELAPEPAPASNELASGAFLLPEEVLEMVVYFLTDSATLTQRQRAKLDAFLDELSAAEAIVSIEIVGHTDSRYRELYNNALSMARSQSVRRYLVSRGVAAEVISTAGRGLYEPASSNATPEGRRLNRRAVVRAVVYPARPEQEPAAAK